MIRPKVLIIGATGMLGGAIAAEFKRCKVPAMQASRTEEIRFDANTDSLDSLASKAGLSKGDYIINCIGLTKSHIEANNPNSVELALHLNVSFPIALVRLAERRGLKVIQVATDCVYSGREGSYSETSQHDALDVYGKSKSLGEVESENLMLLRSSLIGPEKLGRRSLFFDWVRGLEAGSVVDGFMNHQWNGLTSSTFAKIVLGVIESEDFKAGLQHLVPTDSLAKYELIKLELDFLGRADVEVRQCIAEETVDRTLKTENWERNQKLFILGGYTRVPTIREMMEALPWEALKGSPN